MTFEQFYFHPRIQAGIIAAGYESPTSIQLQSIPVILQGRDLLGLAQTGTGKTASFALPILQKLINAPRRKLQALVLSPTRELAEQTHQAFSALGRSTGLKSVTLYGGVSQQPQIKALRAGVEIGVACPGRLLDLAGQQLIDLSAIRYLVIDEADMMFDMGFLPDVRRILALLPKERQTLLFSATMPVEIGALAAEYLQNPLEVDVNTRQALRTITHAAYQVQNDQKYGALLGLIPLAGDGQVLVFTRTKHRAKKLAQKLDQAGIGAIGLQGNLSQNRRQEAMDSFRSGRVQVMVATDIAARGIDVSRVKLVINYDLPDTGEAYTHRTGRTGRMEQLGTALSLITAEDGAMVRTIERRLGKPLQRRSIESLQVRLEPIGEAQLFKRDPNPARRPRPEAKAANIEHQPARPAFSGQAQRRQPRRNPRAA